MASTPLTEALRETLDLFDGSGAPRTTAEVADRLDPGRRSTYERLERLVDRGLLETKKVGANARVWWRPTDPGGRSPGARDRAATGEPLVHDVLDTAEVGVFVLDENFEVAWINEATERYFGIDRDDVVGRDKRQIVAERIAPRIDEGDAFAETVLATYDDNTYVEEFECRVTAGETRWLEHRSRPIETGPYAGGRVELYYDVTERKDEEREVRETARQLRAVLDTVEAAVFMKDPDGRYLLLNQNARDLLDVEEHEDVIGKTDEDLFPEDVAARYRADDARVFEADETVEIEEPVPTPDGTRTHLTRKTPISDGAGNTYGLCAVSTDVTERKERQRQLRTTTERLDAIIEASPDGILVLDEDGTVERWNPAAERIFGWTEDEVLGDRLPIVPEEERARFEERLEAANEGETFRGLEVQRRTKAGDVIDLSLSTAPIHDADGAVAGTVAVLRDVTERKERERQLRTFRKAVEASGHSICFTDTDGTVEYVNPAFEETTGYTAEEAIGRTPRILKSGEHDREFYEELWNTILAGDVWRGELVNATKAGDRYVAEQTIAPVDGESGDIEHFVAVNVDVTERKDRERRYDAIFNGTYQFTGLLEPDGTLLEANESALEFGGIDREEAVGKKFWNAYWFRHGEAASHVREAVERARDGEFVREELEVQGTDRIAVIDFSVRPVTDDRGDVAYLVPEGRDITDRVTAERLLERQREELAALNQINAVVHDVTEEVIHRSTREEIERTVCEGLAGVDSYESAWIGGLEANSRTVTVRTGAGVEEPLDEVNVPVTPRDEGSEGPTARALRTGTIQVSDGADSGREPGRDHPEAPSPHPVAAIPLSYDDRTYGVMTVRADRPHAFDDHEQAVLGQFGEIVGQAIAAAERKRALVSDEVVELEFRVPDVLESMGVDAPADGQIALDRFVSTSDGAHLVYGSVTPDGRETLDALADQHAHWDPVTVISEGEKRVRFQARVTELPFRSGAASRGGSIEEALVEDGDLRLRLHLPPSVAASTIAETVHDAYPNARLLAKRQVPRPRDPVARLRQSLSGDLTDRQEAALEAAYRGGYFEWPRAATGEDVADSLGISPATFSQHLRAAQRTVFESLFASAPPA